MDKDMMHRVIDQVLAQWRMTKPPGVVLILILDAYCIHTIKTVVNHIQSLGIEMIHILAGFVPAANMGITKQSNAICGKNGRTGYWRGRGTLKGLQRNHRNNLLRNGSLMSPPIFQVRRGKTLCRRRALNGFKQ